MFSSVDLPSQRLHLKSFHLIFVFLLTLCFAAAFSTIGVEPLHDGIMFKPALDVSQGYMLFRDTFTQYGALTTLLQAAAIKLFGKYLIVIRLLTALFYAMTSILLWMIWSRFVPYFLATVSGIIYVVLAPYLVWQFLPWSSVYSLFFLVLSLYFLILFIETNQQVYSFMGGVAVSLTFWCRQPVGVFLLASLTVFFCLLLISRRRHEIPSTLGAISFYSGHILTTAAFFLWFYFTNALHDWWLQSIKLAYAFGHTEGARYGLGEIIADLFPVKTLLGPFYSVVWTLIPCIVLILFLSLLYRAFFTKSLLDRDFFKILVFTSVCLASWMQYYPVPCIRHTYWAISPAIGVVSYVFWSLYVHLFHSGAVSRFVKKFYSLIGFNREYKPYLFSLVLTLLSLSLLYGNNIKHRTISGYGRLTAQYSTIYNVPVLMGFRVSQQDSDMYYSLYNTIRQYQSTYPKSNVLTTLPEALYLTFSGSSFNFHPVYVNWDLINSSIYPNYISLLYSYIYDNYPLLISSTPFVYNYIVLGCFQHNIYVLAPIHPPG